MTRWFFLQLFLVALLVGFLNQFSILQNNFGLWYPYMQKIEQHRGAGTIALLADELNAVAISDRAQLLAELQTDFGYFLALKSLQSLELDEPQLSILSRGEALFDHQQFAMYKLLDDSFTVLVVENMEIAAKHIDTQYGAMIEGSIDILKELLLNTPAQQWPELIATISSAQGVPVALQPIQSLKLTLEHKAMLQRQQLVVVENEQSIEHELPANYLYSKVPNSEQVIVMGPIMPTIISIHNQLYTLSYGLIVLFLTVPLMLWIIPTWLSSRGLRLASARFAANDLGARVKLIFASNLNDTAKLFNTMAERLEYLLNRNKLLTVAISHDLRTPIAAMEFSLEMLSSCDTVQARDKQLARIAANLQSLQKMHAELQIYAEFDKNEIELKKQTTAVQPWLGQLISGYVTDKTLSSNFAADVLQLQCDIDSDYMTRALDNLLSNGLRHAKSLIHVTLMAEGGQCLIKVENDGFPIADTDKIRIFDPFVRLDESRSADTEGSGLGLAIVQQILYWHHGSVHVEDSELGGAMFIICLPLSQHANK
ncbi:MAG: hypothetical protein OFPI_38400 [Osedax symbiont Rs2]|nr:MAG: hypothetical protein OFPI_38400 [Osedax symbiont Rs2]